MTELIAPPHLRGPHTRRQRETITERDAWIRAAIATGHSVKAIAAALQITPSGIYDRIKGCRPAPPPKPVRDPEATRARLLDAIRRDPEAAMLAAMRLDAERRRTRA